MAGERGATIFSNGSFLLLTVSALISLIGDQMTLIALPWLMMTLTSDPVAVSAMMALLSLPRAVLVLFGGVLADRFDPVRLLIAMRLSSFALLGGLAALAASGTLQSWHLYPFAFAIGISTAVALPASATLAPRLLPNAQLGSGNALLMMAAQIAMLVGPMTAGLLIAQSQDAPTDLSSFAVIFAIDSASFLLSFALLSVIRLGAPPAGNKPAGGIFARLGDGFRYVGADRPLAFFLVYLAIMTLFVSGPMVVGIPFLVKDELGGSAVSYGAFFFALNLGAMIAAGAAMMLKPPRGSLLIPIVLLVDVVIGALMIVFVNNLQSWTSYAILFVVGMAMAYVQVTMMTRVQKRVDPAYLGRVMAFMMLAMLGVAPLSAPVAGLIVDKLSAKTMFEIVGTIMIVLPLLFLLSRDLRRLGEDTPAEPAEPEEAVFEAAGLQTEKGSK
ncbi:MAG: hypothetical protein DI568_15005 [Sphingomonas sp.]|jgi:MFS family permease|nr:MAG: hypothetical protein DI568_15005 [Sphingomonas sp.]